MARLLKPDGSDSFVKPKQGKTFKLDELQKYVGGYIQVITIGDKMIVMNEEGKMKGLPPNEAATSILYLAGGMLDDFVVGDVVVCDIYEMN